MPPYCVTGEVPLSLERLDELRCHPPTCQLSVPRPRRDSPSCPVEQNRIYSFARADGSVSSRLMHLTSPPPASALGVRRSELSRPLLALGRDPPVIAEQSASRVLLWSPAGPVLCFSDLQTARENVASRHLPDSLFPLLHRAFCTPVLGTWALARSPVTCTLPCAVPASVLS